ncbi:hypothetical protein F4801DRAFT_545271 [Xylaria longipes]|nr:hypothetical protein F4801DRAFT_545271 [Xylaria longipes]
MLQVRQLKTALRLSARLLYFALALRWTATYRSSEDARGVGRSLQKPPTVILIPLYVTNLSTLAPESCQISEYHSLTISTVSGFRFVQAR